MRTKYLDAVSYLCQAARNEVHHVHMDNPAVYEVASDRIDFVEGALMDAHHKTHNDPFLYGEGNIIWPELWLDDVNGEYTELVMHSYVDGDDPLAVHAGYILMRMWRLWEFYWDGFFKDTPNTMREHLAEYIDMALAQKAYFGS